MKNEFRTLKAEEIDVRVGQVFYSDEAKKIPSAVTCLLYKNARVDMTLLDEVYGSLYWQRRHEFKDGKLYCSVGVYNKELKEWIWKEDVGTESNTEADKGQASDSFKRACVNFGLGIELYSSPFIYIEVKDNEKIKYTKFRVRHIAYDENRKITELIIEDNKGNVRFEKYDREKKTTEKKATKKKEVVEEVEPIQDTVEPIEIDEEREKLIFELISLGGNMEVVSNYYKKPNNQITNEEIKALVEAKKRRLANAKE